MRAALVVALSLAAAGPGGAPGTGRWDFEADAPALRDVRVEVRCKPVRGTVDRACGVVFRFQDAEHYYVARANALEDNVNLYRVVNGRREQLKGGAGRSARTPGTRSPWRRAATGSRSSGRASL